MSRVIVVGAGLSGLTAAYRLQQRGVDVTVLEQRDVPGGRVRTERVGDYLVDTGPDAATGSYTRWLQLVSDLGMSDRVAPSPVLGMIRHGRIHEVDPEQPLKAAMTRALTWRGKLRMAAGMARLYPHLRGVDSYEFAASADKDDPSTTAYDYAVKYFGREVAEYLVDGVMRLTTGSGARQTSNLGLLGALTGWSSPTVNIRGGLQAVPAAVAERLADVRYGVTVTNVEDTGDGVRVTLDDGDVLEADGCVVSAMFHTAREIWPALAGYAPGFGTPRSVELLSITLGYRRRTDHRCYLISVPTLDHPDVLLMFMQHNKAPDRAPDGHSLITVYTDSLATARYMQRSDAELEAWAAGVVEKLVPDLAGHRDMGITTRWPKAGYLAVPGYWHRSRALQDAVPPGSRVVLAGDLYGAGSMESAVRWGERMAERLYSACSMGCGSLTGSGVSSALTDT